MEKERRNLTELYLDPDIKMTKTEYIEHKTRIEDGTSLIVQEMEKVQQELAELTPPPDLETLEVFATKIRDRLNGDYAPSPEEKRRILDLLHVKVWLGLDGSVRLSGWFDNDSTCLSSTSSRRCAHQQLQPPGPALHVPVL
jgi:hypothetical protein